MADELANVELATNVPQGHAPLWVIQKRIQHAMQGGGILEGMKWDKEGKIDVDGQKDLPCLTPMFVTIEDEIGPGPRPAAESKADAKKQNTPLDVEITYVMRVTAQTKFGFFRRDPSLPLAKAGLYEWLMRVQDAIETDASGNADASLEQSLLRPPRFRIREEDPNQLAQRAFLEVVMNQRYMHRGQRHYEFPVVTPPSASLVLSSAGSASANGTYALMSSVHDGRVQYQHDTTPTLVIRWNGTNARWELVDTDADTVSYYTTDNPFDADIAPTWEVGVASAPAPSSTPA